MKSSSTSSSNYFSCKVEKFIKLPRIVRFPGQYVYADGLAAFNRKAISRMRGKASMMLTRQQAADYFGVSLSTIQRLIKTRDLEAIKVGRSVRISDEAIKTFMNRKRFSNER